jgi:capsular exopolysaccharide synthesis family protein
MEIRQYFTIIKKWWWLILASTLVASAASYYAVSRMPKIYQAGTTVIVGQSLQQANPNDSDLWISQQLAQTYQDLASRQPILQGAADALGLPYVPAKEDVSAWLVPGTQLLEISVRDTDPERARALADEIAQQLILQTPNEIREDQARHTFLQTQLKTLQENIQATEEEIKLEQEKLDASNSARAIQEYQNNMIALQQKLGDYQSTYASLLQSVEGRTNYISIFEPATTPTKPTSPRVLETVLLAAALGMILALGGTFLIELLDDTVKTADDLRYLAGLPVLGTIAQVPGKATEPGLIAIEQPRSPITEAYRALRTNILLSSTDHPIRTLVVTSAGKYEGKSTTVSNLGVVVAQSGHQVLLVDTDLRRAVLHKYLQVPNENGMTSALIQDESPLNGYLQDTEIENLRVLTSGPLPPDPSQILGSQRVSHFIEELREDIDLTIFDSPPVLPVTDAVVLAKQVDGVLLVAEAGRTRRPALQQTVESLRQVGANVVGIVLNRISTLPSEDYGNYYAAESTDSQRRERIRWLDRIPGLGRLLAR